MIEPKGKRYDQWVIGETYETARRTVTEADIMSFAGISGDFNPLHTDAVFAAATPHKTRIAHGALTFSISTGLVDHAGYIDGTILAFLGASVKWPAPVHAGDTISVRLTPTEKKLTKRPDRGIVKMKADVVNQDGTVVCDQEWTLMIIV